MISRVGGVYGLYGPDSVAWKTNRETALLFGGPRALLLQLAHPLVAAGVREHSDYEKDPYGRLQRTLHYTLSIVFGTEEEAREAAADVNARHLKVRGRLGRKTGRFPAKAAYDARDPELLMWVQATLLDTSSMLYERWIGPLTGTERERHYRESKILAGMLGLPAPAMPKDWKAFQAYFRRMVEGHELAVDDATRKMVHTILHPPGIPRLAAEAQATLTAGLLPERVREMYGLPWGPVQEAVLRMADESIRFMVPRMPPAVRYFPQYRRAVRRVGLSGRKR
ncbi:MAG: oxygenase MpaB family protein [Halobacteria archaeon]